MVASTQIRTAEQLAALPADGRRYELVEGELRMMSPAGGRHGRITARLNALLWNHVASCDLGEVYAAETGFLIARDPDTVRAPDAAFVRRDRAAELDDPAGYPALAPDLVAEVVSPSDTFSDVEAKAQAWVRAGTRMVLVVDPENRVLYVYRHPDNIIILRAGDMLDAGDVVPGWRLTVDDLCSICSTRLSPKTQEAGREATPQVPSPPNCSRFIRLHLDQRCFASNLGERVG